MGYEDPSSRADRARSRSERSRDREQRRRRPFATMAGVIGIIALLGVLTIGGYLFYLQRTAEKNIVNDDLKADDGAVITISPDLTGARQPGDDGAESTGDAADTGDGSDEEEAPVLVGEDGAEMEIGDNITAEGAPSRASEAGDAMNFLIIGSDSRDLSVERGRSDVIVLAHVNSDRTRVDLVHFPRDLFVPIAGTGGSSKINASYSWGGAPMLMQTMQPLLNIPIDHVVIVNFNSFKAMTDAIGGVTVNVAEASPGFSTGPMHMDGETGLRFVRERYVLSQGDISRGERQMAFIQGILGKALSRETLTNPAAVARFVDAATTNLTVDQDLEVSEMRDLLVEMRNIRRDDVHFWSAPWTGVGMHAVAGSIVYMSPEQMSVLAQHLRTDSMESYSDPVSPRSGFGR